MAMVVIDNGFCATLYGGSDVVWLIRESYGYGSLSLVTVIGKIGLAFG